eukprot:5725410-Alexandrium_andersonii.AAC.1
MMPPLPAAQAVPLELPSRRFARGPRVLAELAAVLGLPLLAAVLAFALLALRALGVLAAALAALVVGVVDLRRDRLQGVSLVLGDALRRPAPPRREVLGEHLAEGREGVSLLEVKSG